MRRYLVPRTKAVGQCCDAPDISVASLLRGGGEKRQLPVWLFKIKDTRRNYYTSRNQKGLTAEGNCSGGKTVWLFSSLILKPTTLLPASGGQLKNEE